MRRSRVRRLAFALAFVAIGASAAGAAGEPCETPHADGDWAVASSADAGFDATALCAALEGVAGGTANVHAVLVERHGRLVAELYRPGRDTPIDVRYGLPNPFAGDAAFDANALHDVRSISKSVVGLLVGIAAGDGTLGALSKPALDAFPELADLRTQGRDAITVEHLLTMSSGLDWNEWFAGSLFTSDETRLFWKRDPMRFFFDRTLAHPPGSAFNYSGGSTAALAEILTRATGRPLGELARTELFEPLGIATWTWATDHRGRPLAFAGLRLRPRDLAKLGRLVLQGGRWGERQVVPAAWIAESLRPHVSTQETSGPDPPPFAPTGYGYQWWTGSVDWKGHAVAFGAGIGNGGQRVYVVPELDLTVVTAAGDYGRMEINRVVGRIFTAVVAAVAEPR